MEIEPPQPKINQLLINVHAIGVNRADILQRRGQYPPPSGDSEIIGLEIAGTIESDGGLVARTVLSNALPGINPFAGLHGDSKVSSERLGAIVDLVGPGQEISMEEMV